MNISVPEEMRAEITRLGDQLNWSGLAQEAFAQAIRKHSIPKEPSMENVIERLRVSKMQELKTEYAAGFEEGKSFAMEFADFSDLKQMARCAEEWRNGCDLETLLSYTGENRDAEYFFGDPKEKSEMSDERVHGFVDGAAQIWESVKDKI